MKHEYEQYIKCPYCDYEDLDSWEFDEEDAVVECKSCEKEFNVSRDVEVTYSTTRISCQDNNHKYKTTNYIEHTKGYSNDSWVNLTPPDYKYYKLEVCQICGHEKYIRIAKEDYERGISELMQELTE